MFCILICVQRYEFALSGQNHPPLHAMGRESGSAEKMRYFIEFATAKTGKISKWEAMILEIHRSSRPENWRFAEVWLSLWYKSR